MFIPIGSYYVIDDEKVNILDTDDVSSQVQDTILQEPIRNVKSIEDIKTGHSMQNYLEDVMKTNNFEQFEPRDPIKEEIFFEPKVDGEGKILWEKQDNGEWESQLVVKGKYLGPLHLSSQQNVFTGTPFEKSSKSNWVSIAVIFAIFNTLWAEPMKKPPCRCIVYGIAWHCVVLVSTVHTSYLSFALHRQDFQIPNFTPKNN